MMEYKMIVVRKAGAADDYPHQPAGGGQQD